MKYNEELVGKVRRGEAQIYVGKNKKWSDLLSHIFPIRKIVGLVLFDSYTGCERVDDYIGTEGTFQYCEVIQAESFIVPEGNITQLGDEDNIDLIRDKVNELVRIINNLNK